jgi:hypothetical protein
MGERNTCTRSLRKSLRLRSNLQRGHTILNWLRDFITTAPHVGSCLALLYLVTGEQVVVFLLAVSSIMFLTVGVVYQITMTRTFGLASSGGGIGGYWGDVRSNGVSTAHGSKSTGSIPFMHVVDSQMLAFNQGSNKTRLLMQHTWTSVIQRLKSLLTSGKNQVETLTVSL